MSERPPTMQILILIDTVRASPQIGEILQLCDFFDVLTFFSVTHPGLTPKSIFTLLRLATMKFPGSW